MARTRAVRGQMELPLDWQAGARSQDWQAAACNLDWQAAAHRELLVSWKGFAEREDEFGSERVDSFPGIDVAGRKACEKAAGEKACESNSGPAQSSEALESRDLNEVERNKRISQLAANPSKARLEAFDANRRRFASDFECVCDFDSLYQAHRQARLGKLDFFEVLGFEENLATNLVRLQKELASGTYQMRGYYSFKVYEPKERLIHAAHYPDRVVLHSVCDNVLTPLMERRLIFENVACRKGKGTHFALDLFERYLREHYKEHGNEGYVLKCDVSKYFASINHEILTGMLRRVVRDRKVLSLLEMYIRSYYTEGNPGTGLPLGNQSSQSFALLYLDPVDRLVKERFRCRHYVRYMDDFLAVHRDKEFLREMLGEIRSKCAELNLTLNSKTRIVPFSQGVDFLGWRFFLTDTGRVVRKIRKQGKQRFRRRMRELAYEVRNGMAGEEDVQATLASYNGHLKHGDAHNLHMRVYDKFWRDVECRG